MDLWQNELRDVSALKHLPNLIRLNLADNGLSDVGPLQYLKNLIELELTGNEITEMPEWLLKLNIPICLGYDSEIGIFIDGNPLVEPPIEVVKEGDAAIRSYFGQLKEGKDYVYEAKLILIGEGGAGKTSLANKIINPEYRLLPEGESESTQGIDILRYEFPYQDKNFRVNIWDFGGQEIYHQTHQFFFSKRSLYFLVTDTRKEDTDFYYWLNAVELLSDNSPLIIINNEKQNRSRQIPDQLRADFNNVKDIEVVNLMDNRGLLDLCENLQHHITRLPHIGSPLPRTWIKVREELENDSGNYMSLESFYSICSANGFKSEADNLQLSGYLHDLGVCLHFQDDDLLRKTIILKPTWATAAVYKVLDNAKVVNNFGHFNRLDLANIWGDSQYTTMRGELLALMLSFKLCYQIQNSKDNFIAPQLLENNRPEYEWDSNENMLLRYSYEFMPKGILSQFIVSMHRMIANNYSSVWKTGVVLESDKNQVISQAEIIENYGRREIYIRVVGNRKKELMNQVCYELDRINESYVKIKVSKLIPCCCDTCSKSNVPHFYDWSELKERISNKKLEIECRKPPYQLVNILKLVEDIEVDYNADKTPISLQFYQFGDSYNGVNQVGDKFNIKDINNQNGKFIVGNNNENDVNIPAQEEVPENILNKPWIYILFLAIIYALVVVVLAWDLQKTGMLGNKTFRDIVLQPFSILNGYIKNDNN